jgi:hypothetical protein
VPVAVEIRYHPQRGMAGNPDGMSKKLTAAGRKARKAAAVALYVKQVGRKAQKGVEPNDRRYDREIERQARRMSPLEFDALLRADDE